ncbi:hypothetical protein EGT36_18215 [Agrobacterium sp. FDAARGOS_525]|nr:hypothetical protein EGT36_18215 [Agrobacterium sp. FDAARGOS_525]
MALFTAALPADDLDSRESDRVRFRDNIPHPRQMTIGPWRLKNDSVMPDNTVETGEADSSTEE